jgi:hypothetical protein
MATRPNVQVSVVDNSFVIVGAEGASTHVSGMFSLTTPSLVDIFGTTAENDQGYMTVTSLGDWVSRLNGTTYGGVTGQGPTGGWKTDWYSAYNYLTYGGALNIAESATTFFDTSILLDSVFTSTLTQSQATAVENTVSDRADLVGIIGVTYAGYTAGGTVPSGVTSSFTLAADSNIFAVGGEKVMLGLSNSTVGENFVTIPLASDAAGCFARTDRDANAWFSPAGTRRGRILNTVRLIKNPKNLEQDYLYTAKINSVIGVPGQGTFLFGDITQEGTASSSLTRVNVVRLINYIKKVLGDTARTVLFEVNDEITRSLFANAASGFLQTIKEGRGLFGYKVVCDSTNNTADIVDANQFVVDIYIQPTKSINYVKITITNLNTSVQL